MKSLSRKFEIGLFTLALLVLVSVWAINGYDDTWLYVMAAVIAIPVSWFTFGKKNKGE